jgi:hypothetical protein
MDKQHILSEIKRTAAENGGNALGRKRFTQETGINEYNTGMYWDNWSSAVKEAGFEPNTFFRNHSHEKLMDKLIELIRDHGQFPTRLQFIRKHRRDPSFPDASSFSKKIGGNAQMASKILAYCQNRTGFDDVVKICSVLSVDAKPEIDETAQDSNRGGGFCKQLNARS